MRSLRAERRLMLSLLAMCALAGAHEDVVGDTGFYIIPYYFIRDRRVFTMNGGSMVIDRMKGGRAQKRSQVFLEESPGKGKIFLKSDPKRYISFQYSDIKDPSQMDLMDAEMIERSLRRARIRPLKVTGKNDLYLLRVASRPELCVYYRNEHQSFKEYDEDIHIDVCRTGNYNNSYLLLREDEVDKYYEGVPPDDAEPSSGTLDKPPRPEESPAYSKHLEALAQRLTMENLLLKHSQASPARNPLATNLSRMYPGNVYLRGL